MAEAGSEDKKSAANWSDLEIRDAPDFPGKEHLAAFARMEVVFDKLKILQFEAQLMPTFKRMGYKAITRFLVITYFQFQLPILSLNKCSLTAFFILVFALCVIETLFIAAVF